jgi:Holliday junction resolvase-like predicted endonuclease
MENPGERLVGDYLRYVKNWDFVDFNVYTKATQGEIDVIAVARATKEVYICEVVTHLSTGIQYVKNARPDTSDRLIRKFVKDIHYGKVAFADHTVKYMLWSPVVKRSKGKPEYDQYAHIARVVSEVKLATGIDLILVINKDFVAAIDELRSYASRETKELKSPVIRLLQIEEWARKNLKREMRHVQNNQDND